MSVILYVSLSEFVTEDINHILLSYCNAIDCIMFIMNDDRVW